MWMLVAKMIPFRDYAYAAAAIAAVVWYNVHVHNLEVGYAKQKTDAIYAAVDAVQKAAKAKADEKEKQYQSAMQMVQESYNAQIADANTQHDADLERVRKLTAQIRSGSVSSGSTGTQAGADAGAISVAALGVGAELADALRHDDASLQLCWDERDAVGK